VSKTQNLNVNFYGLCSLESIIKLDCRSEGTVMFSFYGGTVVVSQQEIGKM